MSTAAFPKELYQVNQALILEASAGSGKTTALVERFYASLVYLLLKQRGKAVHHTTVCHTTVCQTLDRIIAITFTRKASAEMQERIRLRFQSYWHPEALQTLWETLRQAYPEEPFLQAADAVTYLLGLRDELALSLSSAHVQTVDALALDWTRRFPEDSGIDPLFSPAARGKQKGLEAHIDQAALEVFRSEAFAGDWQRLAYFFPMRQMDIENADSLLSQLLQRNIATGSLQLEPHWEENAALVTDEALWEEVFRSIQPALKGAMATLAEEKRYKPLIKEWAAWEELVSRALQGPSECVCLFFQKFPAPTHKPVKDEMLNQLRQESFNAYQEVLDAVHRVVCPPLWRVVRQMTIRAEALSRVDAKVSYREVMDAFLRLLDRENSRVFFRAQVDFVLWDEFQDTNRVQDALLQRLLALGVVPFLIGDPKQSIYLFREADPQIFHEWAERHPSLYLERNYRSTPTMVRAINTLFGEVFADSPNIEYRPQSAFRQPGDPLRQIEGAYFIPVAEPDADVSRAWQAQQAVALVEALLQTGQYQARDFLFLKSKNHYPELEQAFANAPDVPVQFEEKAHLTEARSIQDILHYLRTLAISDNVALWIAALKTPFFAWSDADIAGTQGSMERMHAALEGTAEYQLWSLLHHEKDRLSLADLVETLIFQSGYELYLSYLGDSYAAQELSNLRLFLDTLHTREDSLVPFLHSVSVEGLDVYIAEIQAGVSDKVRVMTKHAAKGLQARVVFSFSTQFKENNVSSYYLPEGDRVGYAIYAKDRVYTEIEETRKQEVAEERKRVAYVTMTRAEEAFIHFMAEIPRNTHSTHAVDDIFHKYVERTSIERLQERIQALETRARGKAPLPSPTFASGMTPAILPQVAQATVTQLLDYSFDGEKAFHKKYVNRSFKVADSWEHLLQEKATLRQKEEGDLFHEVVALAHTDGSNYPETLRFICAREGWVESQEVLGWLREFYAGFAQDKLTDLVVDKREWNVRYLQDGTILQATIDRYVVNARNQAILIDYKRSIAQENKRYVQQLAIYRHFLQQAGFPVDETWLYDMQKGKRYLMDTEEESVAAWLADRTRGVSHALLFTRADR